MTITPERVAAARAARELGCVTRTEGAMSFAASNCIENRYFDTLVELCRQQHEALALLMADEWRVSCDWGPRDERDTIWSQCEKVLALWPDDPTAEAR